MPRSDTGALAALRREARDLLELVLLPGVVALLPWWLGFRVLRFVSRRRWPYAGLGADALAATLQHNLPADPGAWLSEYRLTQIVEHADFWLSKTRSDRWLRRHLRTQDDWPARGPFLALGFVWGNAGYWCLRQLGRAGHRRALVYRPVGSEDRRHGFIRYHYLRARARHFHAAAGGEGIPTGGAWQRIRALTGAGYGIVVVADAPPGPGSATVPVQLLDRPARLRAGVFRLAVESGVPVVIYSVKLDRASGRRLLRVSPPLAARDPESLATEAARHLDALLREDAAAWFYWSGADAFFADAPA